MLNCAGTCDDVSWAVLRQPGHKPVFGADLASIQPQYMDVDTGLPRIVLDSIGYLRDCGGLDTKGIFRQSANANSVKRLVACVNSGDVDIFGQEDVHAAAALLKAFFRELQDPVVGFQFYALLINNTTADAEAKCNEFKAMFDGDAGVAPMPERNKVLLRCLFSFLCDVSANDKVNMMNNANLSVVFGPNLLRSRNCQDASTMLTELADAGKVNNFVKFMLEKRHFEKVFSHAPPSSPKPSADLQREARTVHRMPAASIMAWLLVAGGMVVPGRRFLHAEPAAWTKQGDRFSWRMKSTVESPSLWLSLPSSRSNSVVGQGRHIQAPLCQLASSADTKSRLQLMKMDDLNAAQRAEICMRPSAALQYADYAGGRLDSGTVRIFANAWVGLNHHPFQPKFNHTVNMVGLDDVNELVLPWTRAYSAWSPTWRPVWQRAYAHLAKQHLLTPEFFALSQGVPGVLPWLQGQYTPQIIEVLDGSLDIRLKLRNGKEKVFTLDRKVCTGGSLGGSTEYKPVDACRAEFPTNVLTEWEILAPRNCNVFFVLAWADASYGRHGDRFHFLID